jgi:hypothetical protein
MTCIVKFFIVVKGRETGSSATLAEAQRRAAKLRNIHGKYNVWLRPHFALEVR